MFRPIFKKLLAISACACVFSLLAGVSPVFPGEKRVSTQELRDMLGNPDLVIIDVRDELNWSKSGSKIQGANHENPEDVQSWAGKYSKDKSIVLYCS